jgi:hypothetical protein
MQLVDNDAYTSTTTAAAALPRGATVVLVAWSAAAAAVVGSGAFARAPAAVLPGTIAALTALTLAAVLVTAEGRRWADRASLAGLALFHAWRVVPGVAFLVLLTQGALLWAFAGPGGVGDVAVAVTAPLAAWAAKRPGRGARAGYAVWSALGFADLANVVVHGALCTRADPASMHLLRELPLGLLPTFAVPLTFAAHILAFRRLRLARAD